MSNRLDDQAQGLRKLFATTRAHWVPVLSNPEVAASTALLELLCRAYAELGLQTLLVDAGERVETTSELAAVDMSKCIERLSGRVSYLAARGLPMRYLNHHGSAAGFLDAVIEAAPQVDVILLHASAPEMARMLTQPQLRPLLLADTDPRSVTSAYASLKWMAQRTGLLVYSVLMSCPPQLRLATRIAQQLSQCADTYLGAAVADAVCWDTRASRAPLSAEVLQLARELLMASPPGERASAALLADTQPLRPSRHAAPVFAH